MTSYMNRLIKTTIIAMTTLFASNAMAQSAIDLHCHFVTPEFLSDLKNDNRLLDEGFPIPSYSVDEHLRWMDEAGISTSVLTLPAPQPASAATIRMTNETAARLKKEHPSRFLFCAALPLPDVEAAIQEAVYALDTLKADGIKLATNVGGQYLGDPALDPLFAELNKRNALIILHPHRPEPVNAQVMGQTPLAMQEYLSETTRAVANMISRNVLARYANLKVVVPHCGAYLPLAIPRMKSLAPVMQANKMVGEIDWDRNLSALYYDLAGAHSPEVMRMMLSITTPDHLLYGSDYPYVKSQVLTAGLARMRKYLAEEPDLAPFAEMILHKNAEWLLGMSQNRPSAVGSPAEMIVRIAEIEVYPNYLNEYLTYAEEVDRRSLELEPGVISLFPMQSKENPHQIRILEIYASEAAYQQHLTTEHFQKYKQGTAQMVKSLRLPNFQPLSPEVMPTIFKKLR